MALTLIRASGPCHSIPRDENLQVRPILSLLSFLQPVSRQYIRANGSPPLRVCDIITPTGHEKFSDIANYVPYQAWKKDTFQHVNKENDARKNSLKTRINMRKQQSWCRKSVSDYLGCDPGELDLILHDVEPSDMDDCIKFLAVLPEEATKSNIQLPVRQRGVAKFSTSISIPLCPLVIDNSFTLIEKESINHPRGKSSFHISEGLLSTKNWDRIPSLLNHTSAHAERFRRNPHSTPTNIKPKFVHVPSSDMTPWFAARHYSIDYEGMCSLTDISDRPTGHRFRGIEYINTILSRTEHLGYMFKDYSILNQNIYGLRVDPNPGQAGITVSSPNITFWNNQDVASDKTANEERKGWVTVIPSIDSNHTDILATGFAAKPNSEILRLTVDASGPHAPDVDGIPLSINGRKKLFPTTPPTFEWADARKVFRAIAYIVQLALFSEYSRPRFIPIGFVVDLSDYFNHLVICYRDRSVSSRIDIDPVTGLPRIVKPNTATYGFMDLPQLAQRSSNLTDYAITALMHEWLVSVASLANGETTTPITIAAQNIFPESIRDYMTHRKIHFADPRQHVPSVVTTFIDDTSGASYNWVVAIANLVKAFIVHKRLETPINFPKLQVGQAIDLLGLCVDLIRLVLRLTKKSINFWNHYILRFKKAVFIEFTELEKIVGKLYWSLEVRPELKIFVYRMFSFLHNSKAWSKQDGGLIVARIEPWLRRDLLDCTLLPLLHQPSRPLCLFNELAPIEGSLKNLTDSCRNQRINEECGLGGIILCGKFAIVWFHGLTTLQRKLLPIHVTECAANVVACYVIQFFFLCAHFISSIHEFIDNQAALTALTCEKSRDIRLVELVQIKNDFMHSHCKTSFNTTYIESARNTSDIASHGHLHTCAKILYEVGYEQDNISIITNGHPCLLGVDSLLERLCTITNHMQDQHKSRYTFQYKLPYCQPPHLNITCLLYTSDAADE